MNTDYDYRRAEKRVKAKKKFYKHFTTYSLIIGFLFLLNMLTSPFDLWFYFPALGWGLGLAFHYVSVFGLPFARFHSDEWEEKEMEKELRKSRKPDRNILGSTSSSLEINEELELKELKKRYNDSDFV